MACLIIEVSQGLDRRLRRRANWLGPPCVATSSTYSSMLETAGFVDVERVDCTDDYRRTAAAWLAERERRGDDARALLGDEAYEDKVKTSYETIEAIDRGLLRRYFYVASRRGRARLAGVTPLPAGD